MFQVQSHVRTESPREGGFIYAPDGQRARRHRRMTMVVVLLTAAASAASALGLHFTRGSPTANALSVPHIVIGGGSDSSLNRRG